LRVSELPTPSVLVNLDILRVNVREMADLCRTHGKELWPMVKTHKSTAIARMQHEAGAGGFLAGTIEEAEALISKGFKNIMMAYPIANPENLRRVITLSKGARIILTIDNVEVASLTNRLLREHNASLEYLVKIDSGGHRLGVKPEDAANLLRKLQEFNKLRFAGICTHPGHAYASKNVEELRESAEDEVRALRTAATLLRENGYEVSVVATGSTPTAKYAVKSDVVTVMRPGNYVFYDAMQVALGTVKEDRCALSVLATVISRPAPDRLIIDAGSKTLSADRGAHSTAILKSYGIVRGHPELKIVSLSEEVGKVSVDGSTDVRVGDKIEIIPTHACVVANNTSYLIGYRGEDVEALIPVDARERTKPPITARILE